MWRHTHSLTRHSLKSRFEGLEQHQQGLVDEASVACWVAARAAIPRASRFATVSAEVVQL